MLEVYNRKFNRKEIIIHPGDYYCSGDSIVISTILGSCISVALVDSSKNMGGLNHFLLPQTTYTPEISIIRNKSARYGVFAMELLINQLMKMGSNKDNLTAKVFGGGSVLNINENWKKIGQLNIQFILEFLTKERIPMTASDTGDFCGRKVFFFPDTGKVLVKKLQSQKIILDIQKQESEMTRKLKENNEQNKIILF